MWWCVCTIIIIFITILCYNYRFYIEYKHAQTAEKKILLLLSPSFFYMFNNGLPTRVALKKNMFGVLDTEIHYNVLLGDAAGSSIE